MARKHPPLAKKGQRVAIIDGVRTPFAKQATVYTEQSALQLGILAVSELIARTPMDPAEINQVVFGQVLPSIEAPNIAREIVLGTGMSPKTEAFSVSRACATSFQSAASATEAILAGAADVVVAGGADSASVVPITVSKKLSGMLLKLSKARSVPERLKLVAEIRPKDLVPKPPAVQEFSTGLSMGEHAEQMAKDWGIPRAEQDEFAHRSHSRASKAWKSGLLSDEVMTAFVPPYREPFREDNLVRHDSNLERYAKLKPAFDRKHGTLTAANSSPLTDGAASLLLMSEKRANSLGLQPLGFVRSYAFAALAPDDGLLMGPAYATPIALDRAGVAFDDLDLVDMHEAFAAQCLCNIRAFESEAFAREKLNRSAAIGEIDMDKYNVNGGSIAFGHPFAATGARMISQTVRELRRRGGGLALTTACAAGAIGAAMVLEVE